MTTAVRATATHQVGTDSMRRTALAGGVLYLMTFLSIPRLALFGQVLDNPDYVLGSGPVTGVVVGIVLELIVALAIVVALLIARDQPPGGVLADLTGDVPAVLGTAGPEPPGLAGWLSAGSKVPAAALVDLAVQVCPGLDVLGRGSGALDDTRARILGSLLDRSHRPVVADCGNLASPGACRAALDVARAASLKIDGPPGFFLATHADDAAYFATRRGAGTILEYRFSAQATEALGLRTTPLGPLGRFGRFAGDEAMIPVDSFSMFNSLRASGEITVAPYAW
jgi:hypothetical protein